ncbi:hypothetical protein O0I10_012633 [Lichtheimia ornata]|uniref:Uncharacterized protein n=1 Tax=Lichtheimia ornata TaxID=688661 RepID=A0AAD7XT16_9FUNG|nr:uncharacterized protein O0I10_012633 [Lichtheimia ornata]KAJ8651786.1 hypothetical protein O0I10_012633 [Lichtheimia ornata]
MWDPRLIVVSKSAGEGLMVSEEPLQAAYIYGQVLYHVIIAVTIDYLTTRNVGLLGSSLFEYPMVDVVVVYSRDLLVFWCLVEVYKATAMIANYGEDYLYFWVVSTFIGSRVVGYQATSDFSGECQPMHVFYEWIVSATNNNIYIVGVISSFIPSSGASRYWYVGGHPEMKISYQLITSAARSSISRWFWQWKQASTSLVIPRSPMHLSKVDANPLRISHYACLLPVDHISTTTKQQSATEPMISLVSATFTRFSGGSRYWPIDFKNIQQRMSLMGVSHQQQVTINVTCLFGAVKVYPSLKAFVVK